MAARGGATRCYIDSCVFIEVIQGKINMGLDHPDHYDNCVQLLMQMERGELSIYASTLVYVEVFHRGEVRLTNKRKSQPASTEARKQAGEVINGWFRQSKIRWVEVHLDVVEDSRVLANKIGCDSADAVHLQTALDARCTKFYTLDQKLIRAVEAFGGFKDMEVLLPNGEGQQAII